MQTVSIETSARKASFPPASILGLGCAPLLGRVGRRDSFAALTAAYDAGITFYDTARSYGYGAGEGLIGEFFAGRKRQSVIICTKFGILPASPKGWKQKMKPLARTAIGLVPALRTLAKRQASDQFVRGQFSVSILQSSLEKSLQELRTDYVDMLLLHAAPQTAIEAGDLMEALERLCDQGKVRMAGVSGEEDLIRTVFANRPRVLETAQFAINLGNLGLIDYTTAASEYMFLVANQPFGGTDGIKRSEDQIAKLRLSEHLPPSLNEKLDPEDPQLFPELALNCILNRTGVSIAIPAMIQPKHLRSNVKAVEHCRFTPDELAMLRAELLPRK